MTATPDKDILNLFHANAKGHIGRAQEAKEWFELYRDGKELPEKGQAFLQDCVRELNGIPHEADNIHNGGAAVPSGVVGTFQNEKGEEGHIVHLDSTSDAGWRDDVPDESKPDQENVSVPQEGWDVTQEHEHNGKVVQWDKWETKLLGYGFTILNENYGGYVSFQWRETGRTEVRSKLSVLRDAVLVQPSPLREQDKQDAGSVVGVSDLRSGSNDCSSVLDSENVVGGERGGSVQNSSDHDAGATEGDAALSGSDDTPEGNPDQSESAPVSEEVEGNDDAGTVSEVETSTSIESDEEDYPSSDETLEEPSRTDSLEEGARNNGTVTEANHPLAEWIMEQEWVENITADITEPEKISYVMGEYVLEGGTVVNIEELLSDYTPIGWERYSEATTRNGLNYDFVEPTGEVWINQPYQDLMDVANAVHVLFIREHKETPDDQEAELEAGEGAPSASLVAQAEQRHVDESRILGGEVGAGGERELTEPDSSTVGVDTGLPQTEHNTDVTEDPKGSTPDVGATSDTMLSNDSDSVEQPPLEDNGLEYLIKEQAKEFTPEEQKFIDLVEEVNGHTFNNSSDNGVSNDVGDDLESSSDIVDREVSDE